MLKGLVLYAKWNPVTYPVIFKDSMDETNIFDTQNIPRGKTVNPFILKSRDSYSKVGLMIKSAHKPLTILPK